MTRLQSSIGFQPVRDTQSLSFVAQAGLLKRDPDYSNYDVTLYEQITNHIKAKARD